MKKAFLGFSLLAAVLALGCTTSREFSVRTEVLSRITYPSGATFHVVPVQDLGRYAALTRKARLAVKEELEARGFRVTPAPPADFEVAVGARFSSGGLGASQQYSKGGSYEPGAAISSPARSGVLTIEIRRPGEDKPLWRGSAAGLAANPVEARDRLAIAVHRVLAEFPPIGSTESR
jgi:hypothetical protein